jgi:hypothetical protein
VLIDLVIANLPQGEPEDLYPFLLTWWAKWVSSPQPSRKELTCLHKRLCNLEAGFCPGMSKMCLQNLLRRLEDARELGLSLQLPLWTHFYEQEAYQAWNKQQQLKQKKLAA